MSPTNSLSFIINIYQPYRYGYGSIPIDTFLVGWTSIYQLFWGSLGVQGFDTLPYLNLAKKNMFCCHLSAICLWVGGESTFLARHQPKESRGFFKQPLSMVPNACYKKMDFSVVSRFLAASTNFIYFIQVSVIFWVPGFKTQPNGCKMMAQDPFSARDMQWLVLPGSTEIPGRVLPFLVTISEMLRQLVFNPQYWIGSLNNWTIVGFYQAAIWLKVLQSVIRCN